MSSYLVFVLLLLLLFVECSSSADSSITQDYVEKYCRPLLDASTSFIKPTTPEGKKTKKKTKPNLSPVTILNETNTKRLQRYLRYHQLRGNEDEVTTSSTDNVMKRQQANRHICLLTRITPEVYSYGQYSYWIQSIYAHLHDYVMLPLYPDSAAADYAYHRKLQPMLEILESDRIPCDYLLWIDADMIPIDFHLTLESFISSTSNERCTNRDDFNTGNEATDAHMWISQDVSTKVNTGSILVRNSMWTKRFLKSWIAMKDAHGANNEQLGFEMVYQKLLQQRSRDVNKICILPSDVLNSISPPMKTSTTSDQVMHLAAEDNQYREAIFKEAALALCEEMQSLAPFTTSDLGDEVDETASLVEKLPTHLGLTKDKLQLMAIDVYGQQQQELQANLIQSLAPSSVQQVSLDLLSRYRTIASKYCFALVYQHHNQEYALSLKLRWKAVQLYLRILSRQLQMVLSSDTSTAIALEEVLQSYAIDQIVGHYEGRLQSRADIKIKQVAEDIPELVKLTLEMAYEYVTISDQYYQQQAASAIAQSLCSKTELYNMISFTIPQLLQVLHRLVHRSQVNIVQQMLQDFQHFQQHVQQLTALFPKHCSHLFTSNQNQQQGNREL